MWRHFTLCIMATLRSRCGHYIFVLFLLQWVSRVGSITARHSGSGREPNFAALNRGCHLYLAGQPSRWVLAHILVCIFILQDRHPYSGLFSRTQVAPSVQRRKVSLMPTTWLPQMWTDCSRRCEDSSQQFSVRRVLNWHFGWTVWVSRHKKG